MFSNSCIYITTYNLLNACLFSMQYIWLFLDTIFFLFAMNFVLLARDKTKKYFLISQRIINCNKLLASPCITVYQQDQCSHSDTPLEKGLRKRASVWNESTLVNYNILLEWNTQYCMQKASFWCLMILSLLLTKPVSQITYRDTIADAGNDGITSLLCTLEETSNQQEGKYIYLISGYHV